MTSLTWAEVDGGNTLADLDPEDDPAVNPSYPANAPWHGTNGQSAVVYAWSGGAWDDGALTFYIFGGGHADYGGNELYKWDAATGAFERITNPTGSVGNTGTLADGLETSAVCFDGQPRSFHTYNNLAIRNGELWCSGGSPYQAGGFASRPFRFDAGLNEWVKEGDQPMGSAGSLCYDSVRDKFFGFGTLSSPPVVFDPISKTFSNFAKGWTPAQYNHAIYDPVRDAVFVFKDDGKVQVLDAAGTASTVNLTISGTGPTSTHWGHMGWAHDSREDRYLGWDGGSTVYTLTPPAGDFRTGTWVLDSLTLDASNAVTPSAAQTNGTFGRFQFSDTLNGCLVLNAYDEHVYFLALGAP